MLTTLKCRVTDAVPVIAGAAQIVITDPPEVLRSSISSAQDTAIKVVWDRGMKATANIKDAISIIIDGAAAIHPESVTITGTEMLLVLPASFLHGQVVTWSYDDQHATETLESIYNVEADNQTYAVSNKVQSNINVSADNTNVSVDTDSITADKD